MLVSGVYGQVAQSVLPYLMAIHIGPRPVWLVRAGEGVGLRTSKTFSSIGSPLAQLTESGKEFAEVLSDYVRDQVRAAAADPARSACCARHGEPALPLSHSLPRRLHTAHERARVRMPTLRSRAREQIRAFRELDEDASAVSRRYSRHLSDHAAMAFRDVVVAAQKAHASGGCASRDVSRSRQASAEIEAGAHAGAGAGAGGSVPEPASGVGSGGGSCGSLGTGHHRNSSPDMRPGSSNSAHRGSSACDATSPRIDGCERDGGSHADGFSIGGVGHSPAVDRADDTKLRRCAAAWLSATPLLPTLCRAPRRVVLAKGLAAASRCALRAVVRTQRLRLTLAPTALLTPCAPFFWACSLVVRAQHAPRDQEVAGERRARSQRRRRLARATQSAHVDAAARHCHRREAAHAVLEGGGRSTHARHCAPRRTPRRCAPATHGPSSRPCAMSVRPCLRCRAMSAGVLHADTS